jgi:hypothetical protein
VEIPQGLADEEDAQVIKEVQPVEISDVEHRPEEDTGPNAIDLGHGTHHIACMIEARGLESRRVVRRLKCGTHLSTTVLNI